MLKHVNLAPDLPVAKSRQLECLLEEHQEIFTDVPDSVCVIEQQIQLTTVKCQLSSDSPIRSKASPLIMPWGGD